MAVQRQSAASRSAKPESNAQHLLETGEPTTILTSPRMSAQAPSFNVSFGHFPDGGGGEALGVHVPHALVDEARRESTKMVAISLLEAIARLQMKNTFTVCFALVCGNHNGKDKRGGPI